MIEHLIDNLQRGITKNGHILSAQNIGQGRFREELNFELHYHNDNRDNYLLYAKIFQGRPPDYLPWVELFDIEASLNTESGSESYYGSTLEDLVLSVFSDHLGAGASLFVEYYADHETRKQLQLGLPVVLTRLGSKMWHLGFTWFKDWYFPEGYLEGNQKLQGEKPINGQAEKRHNEAMLHEIESFAGRIGKSQAHASHIATALARRDGILAAMQKAAVPPIDQKSDHIMN